MMNQVLQAFRSWDERQQKIDQIGLAKGDQTAIVRLKLDHFRQCRHRLGVTAGADEKPFLPLLDDAIKRLEKELYPNLLSRLFFRLKDRFIDGPAYLQHLQQRQHENITLIREQLHKTGLGSFSGELEKQLASGIPISLACQLDQQRTLKAELHFSRDADGNYQFSRIDAAIGNTRHQFNLKDWPGVDMSRIKNLLEGRAVKQDYTDLSGRANTRWVELAPEGQVKQYLKDYGYDPAKDLEGLPVSNKEAIITQLEKGNLVKLNNGFLQADPANRTVLAFDEKHNPVKPDKLFLKADEQQHAVLRKMTPDLNTRKVRKGIKQA